VPTKPTSISERQSLLMLSLVVKQRACAARFAVDLMREERGDLGGMRSEPGAWEEAGSTFECWVEKTFRKALKMNKKRLTDSECVPDWIIE
jgi:hypothetical protein